MCQQGTHIIANGVFEIAVEADERNGEWNLAGICADNHRGESLKIARVCLKGHIKLHLLLWLQHGRRKI